MTDDSFLSNAQTAAQDALTQLYASAPFEPVAKVTYQSAGRVLVLADSSADMFALDDIAQRLSASLSPAIFLSCAAAAPPVRKADLPANVLCQQGAVESLSGYLGAYVLHWRADATSAPQVAEFDLVLDLQAKPHFSMHQPPQGYFHAATPEAQSVALDALADMVGDFEKPKFFAYKESICAHSRSHKQGCHQCIDICSTKAIASAGNIVTIDPHLCMGCGACATVCPSGAMAYQYPRVADRGAELRVSLNAWHEQWRAASGNNASKASPVLVFNSASISPTVLQALPANVICLEAWHIASIGLDIFLGALAYGAAGVVLLADGAEAAQYAKVSQREMALAETILHALGFAGRHFAWVAADANLPADMNAEACVPRASFHLMNDKRATVEFAIEHFMRHANAKTVKPDSIPLPLASMFGKVDVNRDTCTMCLACAGACPASALMDGGDVPQLKFIERNCVQCGLCASTCPEQAITLTPRLLLTTQRKEAVVLNETEPFDCISCGKALGTKKLIDNMLGKLAGHSMFQSAESLKRLQMCADCRVVDMMSNKQEMSILTGLPITPPKP